MLWVEDARRLTDPMPDAFSRRDVNATSEPSPHRPLDWFTRSPPQIYPQTPCGAPCSYGTEGAPRTDSGSGPPKDAEGRGKKGQRRGQEGCQYLFLSLSEDLVAWPITKSWKSPVSRLAEQLPVDSLESDCNLERSELFRRARQCQILWYKQRFFTSGQPCRGTPR